MMDQSWAESTWEITNYGRSINQFLLNIIKSMQQVEKINKKYAYKNVYNIQICINEEMLPKYTYVRIYIVVGDSPMTRIMDLPKENINPELRW